MVAMVAMFTVPPAKLHLDVDLFPTLSSRSKPPHTDAQAEKRRPGVQKYSPALLQRSFALRSC
jgi:hypothetical protein